MPWNTSYKFWAHKLFFFKGHNYWFHYKMPLNEFLLEQEIFIHLAISYMQILQNNFLYILFLTRGKPAWLKHSWSPRA